MEKDRTSVSRKARLLASGREREIWAGDARGSIASALSPSSVCYGVVHAYLVYDSSLDLSR